MSLAPIGHGEIGASASEVGPRSGPPAPSPAFGRPGRSAFGAAEVAAVGNWALFDAQGDSAKLDLAADFELRARSWFTASRPKLVRQLPVHDSRYLRLTAAAVAPSDPRLAALGRLSAPESEALRPVAELALAAASRGA